MSTALGLMSEGGGLRASLESVHIDARIEGLMLTIKLRQRYLNASPETIEAVYTFPGGWGSHLLGFAVEIADQRLTALAMPKKAAEHKYEQAIASGDTPVMLELSDQGLYTANLGNLKPGEEALIEIEYAQMLRVERGRVRVTIPTVIGQRYESQGLPVNQAAQSGGLQGLLKGHQKVSTNTLVEYPLSFKIDVFGDLTKGHIACPSHDVWIEDVDAGAKSIHLNGLAQLDRDVVLNIEGIRANSFLLAAKDGDAYAVIASFCPDIPVNLSSISSQDVLSESAESGLSDHASPVQSSDLRDSSGKASKPNMPSNPKRPLLLKILLDCSGSMQGESIEQVRVAMDALTQHLAVGDVVSYSKFGSEVKHVTPKMEVVSERWIQKTLAKAILKTQANLGGTELPSALRSTYQLSSPRDFNEPVNILLITDGDVWKVDAMVKDAQKHGHRIFAIGVGSAPAESLLRDLAQRTGGACELVTPSESIEEATIRMLDRMRSIATEKLDLTWPGGVQWRTALPHQVFSKEMVHVMARVKTLPTEMPVLGYQVAGVRSTCTAQSIELRDNSVVARLCAAARLSSLSDEKLATELALQYQLPSKYTHLILVHEREGADKAEGLPALERIEQMQAAGWGGFGQTVRSGRFQVSASRSLSLPMKYSDMAVPSVWRTNRVQAAAKVDLLAIGGMDDYEIPDFLKVDSDGGTWFNKSHQDEIVSEIDQGFTPKRIIAHVNQVALTNKDLGDLIEQLSTMMRDSSVWTLITKNERFKTKDERVAFWCVMLQWLSDTLGGDCELERHAKRLLDTVLLGLNPLDENAMELLLKNQFTHIREASWGTHLDNNSENIGAPKSLKHKVKEFLGIR